MKNYSMKKNPSSRNFPLITLDSKAKLKITNNFNYLVKYLCSRISNVEWSGIMFFTSEGELNSSNGVTITPIDIFPMDKGNGSQTEYEFGEEVNDYYDAHPERFGMKYGHIHSHHNMGAFFSGVDVQELADNCINHSYYVSLVVNNKGDMVAKMVIPGKRKITSDSIYSLTGILNTIINIPKRTDKEEDVMYVVDMDIEVEENGYGDRLFYERVDLIAEGRRVSNIKSSDYLINNWESRKERASQLEKEREKRFPFLTSSQSFDKKDTVLPEKDDIRYKYPISEIFLELLGGGSSIPEAMKDVMTRNVDDKDIQEYLEYNFSSDNVSEILEMYEREFGNKPTSEEMLYVYIKLKGIANYHINSKYKKVCTWIIEVIDFEIENIKTIQEYEQ